MGYGYVKIDGDEWRALSTDGDPIELGATVRIVAREIYKQQRSGQPLCLSAQPNHQSTTVMVFGVPQLWYLGYHSYGT